MKYRLTTHWIAVALAGICLAPAASADRVIATPSPSALPPDAARLEIVQGLASHPVTSYFANFGSALAEIEVAAFHRDNIDAGEYSVETQILPETSGLPSLAMGIRDIGDNARLIHSGGYYGRAFYAVGGRKPVQFAMAPYPLRNLSYTLGGGCLGIRGPFGSVSADLLLNVHWTLEWDSRDFNERLALPLSNSSSLFLERRGAENYAGFALYTPVEIF